MLSPLQDFEEIWRHYHQFYLADFPQLSTDFSRGISHSELLANRTQLLRKSLTYTLSFQMTHWKAFERLIRGLERATLEGVMAGVVDTVLGSEESTDAIVKAYSFDKSALELIAKYWPDEQVPLLYIFVWGKGEHTGSMLLCYECAC